MTVSAHTGLVATDLRYELGEGVIWDDREHLVRWVDIWNGIVLSGGLRDGRIVNVTELSLAELSLGETVGAVALADDGGLLVAANRRLATISVAGDVSFGPDLLGARTGVRLNDGSVDPQGRFVVGTLSHTGKTVDDRGVEQLLRVSADGQIEVLREGIRLSNGVAFSPDGRMIYHVDTISQTVSSHSYGSGAFSTLEPWRTVLNANDLPNVPDGITVDATGALWVAQWEGSSVRRHAPTGELLDVVSVDATQVSCPGFVGPLLDSLAITTAHEGVATATNQAGALFLAEVNVSGLPAHRWAGSTTIPYWLKPESDLR